MRTFNYSLKDFINKGLARNNNRRNQPLLVESIGAVPYEGVLRAVEEFTRVDTSTITASFPYPQIFVTSNFMIIATETEIYEYDGSTLTLKATGLPPSGTWDLVDFKDYLQMVNGKVTIARVFDTGVYTRLYPDVDGMPLASCICNYNGQVLIGDPIGRDEYLSTVTRIPAVGATALTIAITSAISASVSALNVDGMDTPVWIDETTFAAGFGQHFGLTDTTDSAQIWLDQSFDMVKYTGTGAYVLQTTLNSTTADSTGYKPEQAIVEDDQNPGTFFRIQGSDSFPSLAVNRPTSGADYNKIGTLWTNVGATPATQTWESGIVWRGNILQPDAVCYDQVNNVLMFHDNSSFIEMYDDPNDEYFRDMRVGCSYNDSGAWGNTDIRNSSGTNITFSIDADGSTLALGWHDNLAGTSGIHLFDYNIGAKTFSLNQTISGNATGSGDGDFGGRIWGVKIFGNFVYATDLINYRVQIFNKTTGAFVSKFGTQGSGNSQFEQPKGIDVDGNFIYVADDHSSNKRFQVFLKSDNSYVTELGPAYGNGSFTTGLSGIKVTTSYIYVTDSALKKLIAFTKPITLS
jgi:hypothetical protein